MDDGVPPGRPTQHGSPGLYGFAAAEPETRLRRQRLGDAEHRHVSRRAVIAECGGCTAAPHTARKTGLAASTCPDLSRALALARAAGGGRLPPTGPPGAALREQHGVG